MSSLLVCLCWQRNNTTSRFDHSKIVCKLNLTLSEASKCNLNLADLLHINLRNETKYCFIIPTSLACDCFLFKVLLLLFVIHGQSESIFMKITIGYGFSLITLESRDSLQDADKYTCDLFCTFNETIFTSNVHF